MDSIGIIGLLPHSHLIRLVMMCVASNNFVTVYQLLEKAMEESVEDLDLAIKKLNEFCRGHGNDKIGTSAEENATMEKGMCLH